MSLYLYGIVRRPSSKNAKFPDRGVGEPVAPVRLLAYGDIAAVVSPVDENAGGDAAGVRAMRRDMARHTDVLSRTLEVSCVLPARFGLILPDERTLTDALLEPQYEHLLEQLDRLDGRIEVSVRADYIEERIIAEVVRQQPQLARGGGGYQDRIETGRRIAQAMRALRERNAQYLVDRLEPLSEGVSISKPLSDLNLVRASFLIRRYRLNHFDRALEELTAEAGSRMRLACVGPLPPYSFVDLHLSAHEARA